MNAIFKDFKFEIGTHRQKNIIWIKFNYSKENLAILHQFCKPKFSNTYKCWYTLNTKSARSFFGIDETFVHVQNKIPTINQNAYRDYINQLILKSYSKNTIETYRKEFATFLYFINDQKVENFTADQLQAYFLHCAINDKLSESTINSRINAIKFYYEKVLHSKRMFFDIPRPKKPLQLPKTLNKQEVKAIFNHTKNIKHLMILKLCYGMGLRVSEITNLKLIDIDSENMVVRIERGKGKKDRFVSLPESILEDLRNYYKEYKPKTFLFEGLHNQNLSIRTIQLIFKNALLKANIHKKVGIHCLRHSYATHLLELGTDISHIQKLLGHNSISTTLAYTHVTNQTLRKVISPLDQL